MVGQCGRRLEDVCVIGATDVVVAPAWHHVEQYANNPIESDHARLKHRLCPMPNREPTARRRSPWSGTPSRGKVRRGHYEPGIETPVRLPVAVAGFA
jgi:hypothetical protein